jgi:short-subunit dehydrogenase
MADKHTALITGASSGLGSELARRFAADGHALVLVARRQQELETLAEQLRGRHGVECTVIARDLSHPGEGTTIYGEIEARGLDVSILVNNAGFGGLGPFLGQPLQRQLEMIRVNVEALTELTYRFLPDMVEQGRGHVLNIASTAAFQAGPGMAVYYATKAYVLYLSEALDEELADTGVRVTAFCPGAFASGFQEASNMQESELFRGRVPDAATIARAGYDAMWQGKRVAVPGLRNNLLMQLNRVTPRRVVNRIVKGLNSRE